jgi:hypothetical protein
MYNTSGRKARLFSGKDYDYEATYVGYILGLKKVRFW